MTPAPSEELMSILNRHRVMEMKKFTVERIPRKRISHIEHKS